MPSTAVALVRGENVLESTRLIGRCVLRSGALFGAAVAVLDLGIIGRRIPELRQLAIVPQVADHVAFGALASI